VLCVACEGHTGFPKRIRAAAINRGWGEATFPKDFVLATGRPRLIEASEKGHTFVPHPDDIFAALDDMKAKGLTPVAVAIDTVFRSFGGGNVNAADHMNAYVNAVTEIIDRGHAVVAVHHEIKSGGSPAGSVSMIGAADTIVQTANGGDDHAWQVEMAKDGPETKPRAFTLATIDVGLDPDGHPQTSCVVRDLGGMADGETTAATSKPPNPKLPAAAIALKALRRAIDDGGEFVTSNTIPRNTPVVKISAWRAYAYQMRMSGSDEDHARRAAFKRAYDNFGVRRVC
jgi:hypothetical protein